MIETLPHQLLLLELDDETGKSLQKDSLLAHYGVCGAMIAELMWQDRLVPAAADRFVLRSTRPPPPCDSIRLAEERLSETRPYKLQACMGRLRLRPLRRALLAELVDAGALRLEEQRFLVVFRRRRWHPTPDSPEQTYIEHLRAYIRTVEHSQPPGREDLMLSLLRATKLLAVVWTEAELEGLRAAIDARTERAPIGRKVHEAVVAARAAAAAAAAAAS